MKYNPLYIAIYLIEISMKECLENEYKRCKENLKIEEIEKDMTNFSNKNKNYFKEIMNEFYKIHYEDNEQYIQLLKEDEINYIFNKGKKLNNKINNENNSNRVNDNKIFNNTAKNRFYKRLTLPLNNDNRGNKDINKEKNNNNKNNCKDLEIEDDLNSNLNINEVRKEMNTKNNQISMTKKFKKISMNRINSFDRIDKKKTFEKKTEKTNPIYSKTKIHNYRNSDTSLKLNSSSTLKTIENTKRHNEKKLISESDKNLFKSFHKSVKSSTSTNFYNNKLKSITQNETNSNRTTCNSKISTKNDENPKIINTVVTKKYKKIIHSKDQLSLKSLRVKNIFKDNFDNNSFSQTNIHKTSKNNSARSSIETEINKSNINKELRTKKLSLNFYKNYSQVNNNFKDKKKINDEKNIINVYQNKNIGNNNTYNDTGEDKLIKFKKIRFNKINNDFIPSKSDKKSEIKKIIFKKKQNDNSIKEGYSFKTLNNINNNQTKQKQFKKINKDSSSTNSNLNKTNNQPLFSSFYNIIQRTKRLFNKDKGINENKKNDKKNIDSIKKEDINKNFYKSQVNFYKKEKKININDNKEKELSSSNTNTIIINNNININIENKKDIQIPELNFKNTIITTEKKNKDEKLEGINNHEYIKSFDIKNIFQKFNFNKHVNNKSTK